MFFVLPHVVMKFMLHSFHFIIIQYKKMLSVRYVKLENGYTSLSLQLLGSGIY